MFDSSALKGYLSEHGISESAIAVKAGLTSEHVRLWAWRSGRSFTTD